MCCAILSPLGCGSKPTRKNLSHLLNAFPRCFVIFVYFGSFFVRPFFVPRTRIPVPAHTQYGANLRAYKWKCTLYGSCHLPLQTTRGSAKIFQIRAAVSESCPQVKVVLVLEKNKLHKKELCLTSLLGSIYCSPRGDSGSWGGVDLTSKVNHQYDHMFKNIVNTNKQNTTSMHMASKIFPLQKENNSHILKPGCGSESDLVYLQNASPLHEK